MSHVRPARCSAKYQRSEVLVRPHGAGTVARRGTVAKAPIRSWIRLRFEPLGIRTDKRKQRVPDGVAVAHALVEHNIGQSTLFVVAACALPRVALP